MTDTTSHDRDLTSVEAAQLLGLSRETINRWANEGKLAHWLTRGGQKRFRRIDVEAVRELRPEVER